MYTMHTKVVADTKVDVLDDPDPNTETKMVDTNPNLSDSPAYEIAKKAVDDVYDFRDHYFEREGLERAVHKADDVQDELKKTLTVLSELQDQVTPKAVYFMLYGRALNVLSGFNQEALELLAKAVKLDPSLVEAWNHLGECYWKNNDVKAAHNCFTGALSHSKNKTSLRNLSMVLRQLGSTSEEKLKNVEESVEKAKEAVGFDVKDGTSWFILGNAYLSLFFNMNQSPKVLKQCLSAYTQAERDAVAACNPDLHFNRSIAYKYQEDYQLALIGFSRAAMLDPTWSDPNDKEKNLTDYLEKLSEFIETKGKLKGKKLQTMLKSLSESDLGPYGGGSYTNPAGKTTKLTNVPLASLQVEKNLEKVVVGKVVCSLTSDDPVPFTFCLVDAAETCVAVTTYNIALGYGVKIGDAVAIPEPFVQDVDVRHKDKVFNFRSIRVDTPVVLVVNGRKLGLDRQAPSILAVSAQSE